MQFHSCEVQLRTESGVWLANKPPRTLLLIAKLTQQIASWDHKTQWHRHQQLKSQETMLLAPPHQWTRNECVAVQNLAPASPWATNMYHTKVLPCKINQTSTVCAVHRFGGIVFWLRFDFRHWITNKRGQTAPNILETARREPLVTVTTCTFSSAYGCLV